MTSDRINHLLNDIRLLDEARYAWVQELRKLILAVDPAMSEEVKYGGLLFSAGKPFCGIFSYAQHVSVEFSQGAALADPHQVLEGAGKLRRHIKLQSGQDVQQKHVRDYVVAALALMSNS